MKQLLIVGILLICIADAMDSQPTKSMKSIYKTIRTIAGYEPKIQHYLNMEGCNFDEDPYTLLECLHQTSAVRNYYLYARVIGIGTVLGVIGHFSARYSIYFLNLPNEFHWIIVFGTVLPFFIASYNKWNREDILWHRYKRRIELNCELNISCMTSECKQVAEQDGEKILSSEELS